MGTRTRIRVWKPDDQGQYARQIGWRVSRTGKRTQHKFRLGRDLKEAKRRADRLEQLWESLEQRAVGPTTWDGTALEIAQGLAKGCDQVQFAPQGDESPESYAKRVNAARAIVAKVATLGLSVQATDANLFQQGGGRLACRTPLIVDEPAFAWLLPKPPPEITHILASFPRDTPQAVQMLHDALDGYIAWIRTDYHSVSWTPKTGPPEMC